MRIPDSSLTHFLTFDVESPYHRNDMTFSGAGVDVDALRRQLEQIGRLLELHQTRATFFVLGELAEELASPLRRLVAAGHEIASHGYSHRLVYQMDSATFARELDGSMKAIEAAAGVRVRGFRAPSWSVNWRTDWAFDILKERGFAYDASVFPLNLGLYGVSDSPAFIRQVETRVKEVPAGTAMMAGVEIPFCTGVFFQLSPVGWIDRLLGQSTRADHPVCVVVHSWEFDAALPGHPDRWMDRLKWKVCTFNTRHTESKLDFLLRRHRFDSIERLLPLPPSKADIPPNAGPGRL